MLDITLFLADKGGDPALIKDSQRKRGAPVDIVDEIIRMYKDWTTVRFDLDQINKKINANQKLIGQKMKAKQDATELLEEKAKLEEEKNALTELEGNNGNAWKNELLNIGNIVHDSVPVSMNEDDNQIIRTHFVDDVEPTKRTDYLSHHDVLYRLGGFDQDRGVKIAGHRGYFLTDVGVDLNLALINYGLAFLGARGYRRLMTPFMMKRGVMAKTAQLSQFDEELYKIVDDEEDKYLIATSEQPISAFHADEWFEKPAEQLPIKYAGYSTCFRKEAGAHGKDTWGIFRVHQFEKVEQFVITEPEKSWDMFNDMIEVSEEFFKSLGLSYRLVSIVSGALNNAAAKKYDLEAYFPFQGEYKELVSCSNCTDYQSRRLEIRCGIKKLGDREKKYVHCLNSTLCATERAICGIIENWQRPERNGVEVPPPLRPFMGGRDFLPYVRELPAKKT